MSAKSLRDHLRDDDPEIRRAALLSCGRKDKKQIVPELLALLDDPDPIAAQMAEEGLATIAREHLKDPAAWKAWWEKHGDAAILK
jgi:HEAT repeat protein